MVTAPGPTEEPLDPRARLWKHQQGDEYQIAHGRIEGGMSRPFVTVYYAGERCSTLAEAKRKGIHEADGTDDFSIAAIRGGRILARLWMDEIVDDEPAELVAIGFGLGLQVGEPS